MQSAPPLAARHSAISTTGASKPGPRFRSVRRYPDGKEPAMQLDIQELEEVSKTLYVRALKLLPRDIKAGFAELQARETELLELQAALDAHKQDVSVLEREAAERQMAVEMREQKLAEAEAQLASSNDDNGRLEEELRAKVTRLQSEIESRQERQEELARELEQREQWIAQHEEDLATYADELKDTFAERDAEWWAKQLGSQPVALG